MTWLRVMTFNVENMMARFDFENNDQGLLSLLDVTSEIERANLVKAHWNAINDENRIFTALSAREGLPEVICLQEVDSFHALKAFHDRYLKRIAGIEYPYKALIEGNDPRGIDVAVLSLYPIDSMSTHQEDTEVVYYPKEPKVEKVFRRDCLEVRILKERMILPIFVCHFKSMIPSREETRPIREAEARAVRKILERRFGDPYKHDWLVVGDLNDYTEIDGAPDLGHGLQPILDISVDMVRRIRSPFWRWTTFYPKMQKYQQLDYILASPSLARKNPWAVPRIIRQGLAYSAERYRGPRWPRVGYDRPKASDHCPVVIDLEY